MRLRLAGARGGSSLSLPAVARLVLLNGLPGSGKSTLARRYGRDHPLTLMLDVDVVRGMLGDWLHRPAEAGRSARVLAVEMARTHLSAGHQVLVPQFLGHADFARTLADLAAEVDAGFIEVALIVPPAEAARRFAHRSAHSTLQQDRDAVALLDRQGGLDAMADLHAALLAVIQARPSTRRLDASAPLETTYRALLALLN
jgi:predicted kinase